MKNLGAILLAGLSATGVAAGDRVNFDAASPGQAPPGWTATKTGSGEPRWTVERDASAPSPPNVLRQDGAATYPLCLKEQPKIKDGFVEVRFKAVSGREDQAGGVVWRAQDADNYYVARANALEDNVTIYHTIKGRRVAFQSADHPVRSGMWHTLRVDFQGTHFTVTFDGAKVIEATDASLAAAGRVGLWTKADSVTLFDDFSCGGE